MTNDDKALVERLRLLELRITMGANETCGEAADRLEALNEKVERLSYALRTLVSEFDTLGFFGGPSAEAWDEARTALGEQQ